MAAQKAMAISKKVDSQNSRMSLRSGAKGTGKELWACTYWPNSPVSVDKMEEMMVNEAERLDVEIVWPQDDGEF